MVKLSEGEKDSLLWMYEQTEDWKGALDPRDYSEYEQWLREARHLLTKLGVEISEN